MSEYKGPAFDAGWNAYVNWEVDPQSRYIPMGEMMKKIIEAVRPHIEADLIERLAVEADAYVYNEIIDTDGYYWELKDWLRSKLT